MVRGQRVGVEKQNTTRKYKKYRWKESAPCFSQSASSGSAAFCGVDIAPLKR
jgi:hypothetical protein